MYKCTQINNEHIYTQKNTNKRKKLLSINILYATIMSINRLKKYLGYTNKGVKAMKTKYDRNIKVTMNEIHQGEQRRSSTTLSYIICNYYFGDILYPEIAIKAKTDKRYKDPDARYRKWLEGKVTEWAKTQPQARSDVLERTLLELIYNHGYRLGLEKNKDNNGLDV